MGSETHENFNTIYHALRSDTEQSQAAWMELFDNLADRIILDFRPTTVLDVGCGKGYLVKALRQRGVEAWGINTSDPHIQQTLPESQPYCKVGSIFASFPLPRYDLIVCIDTIEHFPPEEAMRIVENLCSHSEDILFSCTPIDIGDDAHLNAQPPEFWAAIFFRSGYIHDIHFDGSYIAPWAMRFRKSQLPPSDLLFTYEQKLWRLAQENALRRTHGIEQLLELSRDEDQIQYWKSVNAQTQATLDAVLNSNSWRFMTRLQDIRKRIVPIGSRREAAIGLLIRFFKTLRREGPIGFVALAVQKLMSNFELRITRLQKKLKLRAAAQSGVGQIGEINPPADRPKVEAHAYNIDIIITVHNALDDLKRCLDSLLEHTTKPYQLILVDDGSDGPTAQYMHDFSDTHQAILLRSDTATGYTCAANRGMRASTAELLVLLNSDTYLTPEWLDRLVACVESDSKIGIVGPLSNTASWQSVPKIEENGDWASNPLPAGISPAHMARLLASTSARLYVEMPLLNGFCLLIRRKMLDEVGLFDEDNFGQGYGEEDDLVLRARSQGWKMALADDVYIYHAQSKSYSMDKRKALSERSGKILRSKHGEKVISQGIRFCQQDRVLEGIRARTQVAFDREQHIQKGKSYAGKRLLFILPINSPGGGANVLRSESRAMEQMGVKAVFFNLEAHRVEFEKAYPDLSQSTIYGSVENLEVVAQNYDAVIATYNPTVSWLTSTHSKAKHPILGYYIQGFEPWMYTQGSQAYKAAIESYTMLEDMTLFCKTEWTRQQVQEATGRDSQVIGASVDINLYRPRTRTTPSWPDGPLNIAAMIRPESPYREPFKTMQLLARMSQKYKGEVNIHLFGTAAENPGFKALPHDFPWKLYGVLNPGQVANLLSQVDIFIDYSSHQAMGLTAMEAMACGCATIVPQRGGASSYATHEHNSLIVDTSSLDNVWIALQRLLDDEKLRLKLQRNAIYDICEYYPERAAVNLLDTLFRG